MHDKVDSSSDALEQWSHWLGEVAEAVEGLEERAAEAERNATAR